MVKRADRKFIRDVNDAGWHVEQVGQTDVIARCPRAGCGLRAKLSSGSAIPQIDHDWSDKGFHQPVGSYVEVQNIMRARREELGLTQHELADAIGMHTDYFAKTEKPNPYRVQSVQSMLDTCQGLGIQVVFIPGPVQDAPILRTIEDTRDKLRWRRKRIRVDRAKRGADARPSQGRDGRG